MDLLRPLIPAFAIGSPTNKFLFAPGRFIPSTFLPKRGAEWTGGALSMDDRFYPASVLNCTHLSDHLTVLLPIPCDAEEASRGETNKVRVGGVTDDAREQRDGELRNQLEEV